MTISPAAIKALLIALAIVLAGPVRLHAVILGAPVSVPAAWFILAAELAILAVMAWLIIWGRCRFRSVPWPRFAGAMAR
jgi:hypothetical protein